MANPFRRTPMVDFEHPAGQSLFWRVSDAMERLIEQLENHSPVDLFFQKVDRDIAAAEQAQRDRNPPDMHDLRRGRWYDDNPITTNTTGSAGGTGMASIEEVRAGLAAGNELANEGLGALQRAHAQLEQAQGAWMRATEGSGQADVSTANGLIAQAVASLEEVRQQVSAAISASEDVGNRL